MFSNEDVTIGAWMLAMNVNHENHKTLCERECSPYSIAVWDIPKCSGSILTFWKRIQVLRQPFDKNWSQLGFEYVTGAGLCNPEKRMLELHKIESCSKSPTLPSEDEWSFTSYIVIYIYISPLMVEDPRRHFRHWSCSFAQIIYDFPPPFFHLLCYVLFRWQCQKSEESWSFA